MEVGKPPQDNKGLGERRISKKKKEPRKKTA